MTDLESLLAEVGLGGNAPVAEPGRARLAPALQRDRGFPQGFWHPEDADAAAEVMGSTLSMLGLASAALPAGELLPLIAGFGSMDDEEAARRHQIGAVLEDVNRRLAFASDERRFRAFAEDLPGWEAEEPVWLLVTPAERDRLLARGIVNTPQGIEAEYDGRSSP